MVNGGPTRNVGAVLGVVTSDGGVHNVFDQVEETDRGVPALFVTPFECVVEHLVVLAIKHRGFAGFARGVGVAGGGGFRSGVGGVGFPGVGPLALVFLVGN